MEGSWRNSSTLEWSRLTRIGWFVPLVAVAIVLGIRLPASQYLNYLTLLVVLVVGIIGLLLIQQVSILPLSFLIVTAVLLPFNLTGHGGASITSSFAMVAVLLAVYAVETVTSFGGIIAVPRRIGIALFMFLGVAALSLIVGQVPWFSIRGAPLKAQLAGLAIFLLSGGAFLLFATRLNSRRQVERITWVFLAAGALTTLLQIFPAVDHALVFLPGSMALTQPGTIGCMFWTWLVAMAAGQAFLNPRLAFPVRLGLVAVIFLVLLHALVLNAGWTSGWLPALISFGIVLFLRFPRLTISLGLLALPVVLLSTGIFDRFWDTESYSIATRLAAWEVLSDVVGRSPLIGLGPANYYYYTSLFPILGWYVTFSSHNNFVDLIAQTGLVGFSLFFWFMIEVGFLAVNTWRRAGAGFDRAFATGVLAGIVGGLASCMLGDWAIPFVYNVGLPGFRSSVIFWVFLGSIVALARVLTREQAQGSRGQE